MILGVSAEQEELRASVRRFLADRAPLSRVRALMDGGETDWAVWEQAGSQLGLQGLAIPESYGGAGFSFALSSFTAASGRCDSSRIAGHARYAGPVANATQSFSGSVGAFSHHRGPTATETSQTATAFSRNPAATADPSGATASALT